MPESKVDLTDIHKMLSMFNNIDLLIERSTESGTLASDDFSALIIAIINKDEKASEMVESLNISKEELEVEIGNSISRILSDYINKELN